MKVYLLLIAVFGALVSSHSISLELRDLVCSVEAEDSQNILFRLHIVDNEKAAVSEKWASNLPPIEYIWDIVYSDKLTLMLSSRIKNLYTKILLIDLERMTSTHVVSHDGDGTKVYEGGCM